MGMAFLMRLVSSNAVKKEPLVVKDIADVNRAVEGVKIDRACPIFCVSNVTGEGIDHLKAFVQRMPSRLQESGLFRSPSSQAEFHLDSVLQRHRCRPRCCRLDAVGSYTAQPTAVVGPRQV